MLVFTCHPGHNSSVNHIKELFIPTKNICYENKNEQEDAFNILFEEIGIITTNGIGPKELILFAANSGGKSVTVLSEYDMVGCKIFTN